MRDILYAVTNQDGEPMTGGSSNSRRNSRKPHVYTNERNAKLGLRHVEFKEGEGLKIVPYVPLDDLMKLAHTCVDMFPFAGTEIDIDNFMAIVDKYGFGLTEDGTLCPKDEL